MTKEEAKIKIEQIKKQIENKKYSLEGLKSQAASRKLCRLNGVKNASKDGKEHAKKLLQQTVEFDKKQIERYQKDIAKLQEEISKIQESVKK